MTGRGSATLFVLAFVAFVAIVGLSVLRGSGGGGSGSQGASGQSAGGQGQAGTLINCGNGVFVISGNPCPNLTGSGSNAIPGNANPVPSSANANPIRSNSGATTNRGSTGSGSSGGSGASTGGVPVPEGTTLQAAAIVREADFSTSTARVYCVGPGSGLVIGPIDGNTSNMRAAWAASDGRPWGWMATDAQGEVAHIRSGSLGSGG